MPNFILPNPASVERLVFVTSDDAVVATFHYGQHWYRLILPYTLAHGGPGFIYAGIDGTKPGLHRRTVDGQHEPINAALPPSVFALWSIEAGHAFDRSFQ